MAALSVGVALSCQEATQVRVRAYTDVAHDKDIEVAVWVGAKPFTNAPSTSTRGPWDKSGNLGYIVAVPPSDNRSARLDVQVVMGIGRDPRTCSAQDRAGCIVARRSLSYLPRQRLELGITLFAACAGVACAEAQTCNARGRCVSASVAPEACASSDGCTVEGDPNAPPGVQEVGADAAVDGGSNAEAPAESPPEPPLVQYRDLDPTGGVTEGTLLVRPAVDGAPNNGFEVRWAGPDGAASADVFATLPGSNLTRAFTLLAGTRVPNGLDHFSVRSFYLARSGLPRFSPPVKVRADNYPRPLDVGAQAGIDAFYPMDGFVDAARARLVVLGFDSANAPAMRTCDLNGANCAGQQFSLAKPVRTNNYTYPVFDAVERRILFPAIDMPSGNRLQLVVCNENGVACTSTDLSEAAALVANDAVAVLDESQGKLLIATGRYRDAAAPPDGYPVELFRCERAGTGCLRTTLPLSGFAPRLVFGGPTGALYVGAQHVQTGRLRLVRCQRDGSNCSAPLDVPEAVKLDLAPPAGLGVTGSWDAAAMAWDRTNQRLVVIGGNVRGGVPATFIRCGAELSDCTARTGIAPGTGARFAIPRLIVSDSEQKAYIVAPSFTNDGHAVLVRCDLDGANCIDRDVASTTGQGTNSGSLAAASLNPSSNALYVFSRNDSRGRRPWIFRCAADGSQGCTSNDISSPAVRGETVAAGFSVSLRADAKGGLVLATTNAATNARLGLFSCNADAAQCSFADASASQGEQSAIDPQLVLGSDGSRMVVTRDRQPGRVDLPTLFSCAPGAACTARDLAGSTVPIGQGVSALEVDSITSELRGVISPSPYLLRCPKGASGCTHTKLVPSADALVLHAARFNTVGVDVVAKTGDSALLLRCDRAGDFNCQTEVAPLPPLPPSQTAYYTDVYRTQDGRLLLAGRALAQGTTRTQAFFFGRCTSPASCKFIALPAMLGASTFPVEISELRLGVDEARGVAYVAALTSFAFVTGQTTLYRCPLDTMTCASLHTDSASFRTRPDVLINPDAGRLYVATQNAFNYNRPQLLALDLF